MTMEADLIARLKAEAGISAIAGSRVYGHVPQQADYPLIRIQRIGSEHSHDMAGASGVCQALMQIDCIGRQVASVKNLSEAVRVALQGFRGTAGSTVFQSILLTDQRDLHEPDQQGGETGHFRTVMDFTATYQESIPSFA